MGDMFDQYYADSESADARLARAMDAEIARRCIEAAQVVQIGTAYAPLAAVLQVPARIEFRKAA